MKGVSAVIATILMLMITIALSGMAYMYISGMFQSQTATIQLIDSYCSGGTATFIIRNTGTTNITASSLICTEMNADCTGSCTPTETILPGNTTTITIAGCVSGRTHVWRLRAANAISLSAYCQ